MRIFSNLKLKELSKSEKGTKQKIFVPILSQASEQTQLPISSFQSDKIIKTLTEPILLALGGLDNIETYRLVPNSKRIRLTLVNPDLVNTLQLEELSIRMFLRIGKRIIHVIP